MRTLTIALAVALLARPALAQEEPRGGRHRGGEHKTEQPKSKVDEKDYKSALDRIPAQTYDPWGTVRPSDAKH